MSAALPVLSAVIAFRIQSRRDGYRCRTAQIHRRAVVLPMRRLNIERPIVQTARSF